MLATDILTQDHREAISLVERLEGVRNEEAGHRQTFTELAAALQLHMMEEEDIYYPALAEFEEFSDLMDENVTEHEMVKQNLAQMAELSVNDEQFQSLLAQTKVALEAHMETEEDDIFPRSIEVLGEDRINELGNQIDQLKTDSGMSRSAMA
jgi:iron-sulfur cluster repair protein YtfE (RIC family)